MDGPSHRHWHRVTAGDPRRKLLVVAGIVMGLALVLWVQAGLLQTMALHLGFGGVEGEVVLSCHDEQIPVEPGVKTVCVGTFTPDGASEPWPEVVKLYNSGLSFSDGGRYRVRVADEFVWPISGAKAAYPRSVLGYLMAMSYFAISPVAYAPLFWLARRVDDEYPLIGLFVIGSMCLMVLGIIALLLVAVFI